MRREIKDQRPHRVKRREGILEDSPSCLFASSRCFISAIIFFISLFDSLLENCFKRRTANGVSNMFLGAGLGCASMR